MFVCVIPVSLYDETKAKDAAYLHGAEYKQATQSPDMLLQGGLVIKFCPVKPLNHQSSLSTKASVLL